MYKRTVVVDIVVVSRLPNLVIIRLAQKRTPFAFNLKVNENPVPNKLQQVEGRPSIALLSSHL